eukprot:6192428-Pleurochrysis_carterae.AAC.1
MQPTYKNAVASAQAGADYAHDYKANAKRLLEVAKIAAAAVSPTASTDLKDSPAVNGVPCSACRHGSRQLSGAVSMPSDQLQAALMLAYNSRKTG